MNFEALKDEASQRLSNLSVGSLQIDLSVRSALVLDSIGVVSGVKLNQGQILMGRTALPPTAGSLIATNGITIESEPGTLLIGMDPDADVKFHDMSLSGDLNVDGNGVIDGSIEAKNLSGTNTGDVEIEEVGDEPNEYGASLDGQTLTLQPADADHPGVLTAGTQVIGGNKTFKGEAFFDGLTTVDALNMAHGELQLVGYFTSFPRTVTIPNAGSSCDFVLTAGNQTIGGTKTFSSNISAANLSGTNTGDVTVTTLGSGNANGLSVSGQVLQLHPATSTQPGVLTTGIQTIAGGKTFTSTLTVENNISGRYIYVGSSTQNSLLRIAGFFTDTARTYTLPDVGANANFVMTAGNQTIGGTKTFSGTISASNLSGTNSGDVTVTTLGTGNANGLSVSGQVLQLHGATSTQPGVLTTGNQTISGNKTFSGTVGASNLSGSNSGDVTVTTVGTGNANGMSVSGQTLRLHPATATQPGIVTTGAQTVSGSKTFNDGVVVPVIRLNTTDVYGHGYSHKVFIPNAGADSDFVLDHGAQTIQGQKTFTDLKASALTLPAQTNRRIIFGKAATQTVFPDSYYTITFPASTDADISHNTSTGVFTFNRAGLWSITANINMQHTTDNVYRAVRFRVNGNDDDRLATRQWRNNNLDIETLSATAYFGVNETVSFDLFHTEWMPQDVYGTTAVAWGLTTRITFSRVPFS